MDEMLYKSIICIIKCYNRLVESSAGCAGKIPVRECEVNRKKRKSLLANVFSFCKEHIQKVSV